MIRAVTETLTLRGFTARRGNEPGTIHMEAYL